MQESTKEFLRLTKLHFLQKPNNAFLSTLLYNFKVIDDSKEQTISHNLDTQEIHINPNWFTNLTPAQAAGALVEQLYHIGLLHEWRRGNRDTELYQKACDQVARHLVLTSGYELPPDVPKPESQYKNCSTEVVYNYMEQEQQRKKNNNNNGNGNGNGNSPDPLGHDVNQNSNGNQQAQQKMHQALQQASAANEAVSGKNYASFGQEFEELFKDITEGKLDWRTILQKWLNDLIQGELSFLRFDRRMIQFEMYFPDKISQNHIRKVALAFDVSGSVTKDQIKYFLDEMKIIKSQLDPDIIDVVSFNHNIVDIFEIKKQDNFDKVKLNINGGTDLTPVFKHYSKPENKPEFLILFSDLECTPIPKNKAPKFPVIWICIDNPDAQVHFGKLLHIKSADIEKD